MAEVEFHNYIKPEFCENNNIKNNTRDTKLCIKTCTKFLVAIDMEIHIVIATCDLVQVLIYFLVSLVLPLKYVCFTYY